MCGILGSGKNFPKSKRTGWFSPHKPKFRCGMGVTILKDISTCTGIKRTVCASSPLRCRFR
jgi:hypothetical protein